MKLLSYQEAADALLRGEVIAYPTEGVYGFAADAMNRVAVEKLLQMKERSVSKGFIVMGASLAHLSPLIEPLNDGEAKRLLEELRGGYRYTWIVPAKESCPHYLRGEFPTLAIRVTNHPDALALCEKMPVGVVSTSANLHKEAPLESAEEIYQLFGDQIAGVMEGEVGSLSSPTRIVHLKSGEIIRP